MFISSVIKNSIPMSASSGGMHLNALNGSSDGDQDGSPMENAFGGLFGVSLCDNHPYRPQDSGRSFIESRKQTPSQNDVHRPNHQKKKTKEAILTDAFSTSYGDRHRGYLYRHDSKETEVSMSPLSLRRHSLNIDTDRISTHAQCGSDLSLSLEDLSTPTCLGMDEGHRHSKFKDGSSELDVDFSQLSITQVDIDTTEPYQGHTKQHGHHHKKARRSLTNEMVASDRAMKILDKIKENKKAEHSRSRHKDTLSTTNEKPSRPRSSSRHHVTSRDLQDAPPPSNKEQRHHRVPKGIARHSID